MTDTIAEIRERYAGYSLNSGNAGKANEDRGWLLAEVERLREALRDIERGDYSDPMCERTPEQRARDALEGKP
jgi:hypothetical protein